MRPIPPIRCFVWVCAVHEQRACIRAHPPSPPPLIPLVSLWLSPASNARIYCVEGMISTCDLSTVSPRCHSISLLHLSFLFIRSFSHQPSNGKIIPPTPPPPSPSPPSIRECTLHSNNNTTTTASNDDDGKKFLSKENGAVVDCYKCMIGGECLLACRVIIIFGAAISRAHTILYCCRAERVAVYTYINIVAASSDRFNPC